MTLPQKFWNFILAKCIKKTPIGYLQELSSLLSLLSSIGIPFSQISIKSKSTWAIIEANLEPIILNFIFPLLCFSEDDQEIWDTDPTEYVQKKIDPSISIGDYKSPVNAAEELLQALVKSKYNETFIPIVNVVNRILERFFIS